MFSIIAPMDDDRLEQFKRTKRVYDSMLQVKEFIVPTRKEFQVGRYLDDNDLMRDVRLIPYVVDRGFNVSKALNLGVRNAIYDYLVVTSPEVMPTTPVLEQFTESLGKNLICQVHDQDETGKLVASLVHNGFRDEDPAMYFLALFNKKDVERINGWDEAFMAGYAYEDNDFGARWKRAGIPFEVREDIQAVHQYHPRLETIEGGTNVNFQLFNDNNAKGVVRPAKGLEYN